MYQFFVKNNQISEKNVCIEGSDVNHIRNVLRMKPGEKIRITDEDGNNWLCCIADITEQAVCAEVVQEMAGTELPCPIYLFQGLPKSDKMELIIQKAVELGVYEIIPVAMKNCVVKLDEKKAAAKGNRWQEIARSAAKQAKRSLIPEVAKPLTYTQALQCAAKLDVRLVPYENERGMDATRETIAAIRPGQSIGIFIGPEGGFAPEEIAAATEAGMQTISLGNRILRTETAGFTTLAFLIYALESN
jgi:16S rRNA (uracil1498-N3)-methyltransferase